VLRLNFSPSAYLTAILVIAHLMTGAILWLVDVPTFASLAGTVFVVVSLSYYLYHVALLRAPSSIVEARLKADGAVQMQRRDGSVLIGRLLEGSLVHPYLTTILFLPARGRFARAIVVLPDSLSPRRSFASCASG
jgi:toxin CptA